LNLEAKRSDKHGNTGLQDEVRSGRGRKGGGQPPSLTCQPYFILQSGIRRRDAIRRSWAGDRLEVIAELMGLAKIETARIYVHPSLEPKRQAVRKAPVTTWSQRDGQSGEGRAGEALKVAG
jgi:hypothetical protein